MSVLVALSIRIRDRGAARLSGRRRRLWPVLAAICLAACGPSATAVPSVVPGSPTTGGGTLSIAWTGDVTSFDPAIPYDILSWSAERLVFETLVTYDAGTSIVPLLAAAMPDVSPDGLSYTFKLRPGVMFVDGSGAALREMTADDVAFSIGRVLNPALKPAPASAQFLFQNIEGAADVVAGRAATASGIVVVDPVTIRFTLVRPDVPFLNVLAMPFASVVPRERAGDDTSAFSVAPVGTGPYLLTSYESGQGATFRRNPLYWNAAQAGPAEIQFRVGVDAYAAIQQIEAGSLDLIGDQLPGSEIAALMADARLAKQVVRRPLVHTDYVFIDTQAPAGSPLASVAVRRALSYAIDKDNILKLTRGAGVVATCVFPPDLPGHDPTCNPYPYDPAEAKRLLAEAGFGAGFNTEFYVDTSDPDPAIAQSIQQDLAAIGVKVAIVAQPFDTLLETMGKHEAPMGWTGWLQDYPDPSDFVDPILSCASAVPGGSSNGSWYCNPEVDALAADARAEQDQAARLDAYRAIQRRIMEDAALIPCRHAEHVTLVGERVVDFSLHPVWLYDLPTVRVTD
jgi:oligopeptide transport system substrate-binding protein